MEGGVDGGTADLSSVLARVMQAQQQWHKTLQDQLPKRAMKSHPEPASALSHQRTQEPNCQGTD